MKKVLVMVDYYLPGYKGGGPIRTIANMVAWLGDEFEFYIVTSDRDLGDTQPYPGISYGEWVKIDKAKVRYLSPDERQLFNWAKLLRTLDYDLIYLNSFFSTWSVKTAFLRWLRLIPHKPMLLAPRGEFYAGALSLKPLKKQVYLAGVRLLSLYNGIHWHASTETELATISTLFSRAVNGLISEDMIAPNLPVRPLPPIPEVTIDNKPGMANVVFVSRISRKKNLDYAIRLLAQVDEKARVQFDIYGPLEDAAYWEECQALIAALPLNIKVEYKGALRAEEVVDTISSYHVFLFPTLGENFGHVIWEALYGGCLVLTSDQTPWDDLEAHGVGWSIPLDEPERYITALNEVIAMNRKDFAVRAQAAHDYAWEVAHDESVLQANRNLFLSALSSTGAS